MKTHNEWYDEQADVVGLGTYFSTEKAWNAALEAKAEADRLKEVAQDTVADIRPEEPQEPSAEIQGEEALSFEKMAEGCPMGKDSEWFEGPGCDLTGEPCEADVCLMWHFIRQLPKPTGWFWD